MYELRRPSLVREHVSNISLLSPLHNIYKEKSPDFLLRIKIIISADTWISTFHVSVVRVYYRDDNILVLCIRQPLGCVCYWRSCLFRKECAYVVTLVCIVKTRTQCGLRIRTFVLIFVTRAGISIKVFPPLQVTIISQSVTFFITSHILRGRRVIFFPTVHSGRLGSVLP